MINLYLFCFYSHTLKHEKERKQHLMKPFIMAIKLIVYMFTASRQRELSAAEWLAFLQ